MDEERRVAMSRYAISIIRGALDSGLPMGDVMASMGLASKALTELVAVGRQINKRAHEKRAEQLWQVGFAQEAVVLLGIEME